jgi:hypothetical protein
MASRTSRTLSTRLAMPTVPDVRVGVQGNCHWRTDADDGEVGGSMSESTRGGGGTNDRADAGVCICRRRQSSPADSVVPDAPCKLYTRQPDAQWHQNLWHDRPHPIDVIDGMDGLCYRLQEIIFCNIFFCGSAIGDLAIICGVFRRFPARWSNPRFFLHHNIPIKCLRDL